MMKKMKPFVQTKARSCPVLFLYSRFLRTLEYNLLYCMLHVQNNDHKAEENVLTRVHRSGFRLVKRISVWRDYRDIPAITQLSKVRSRQV